MQSKKSDLRSVCRSALALQNFFYLLQMVQIMPSHHPDYVAHAFIPALLMNAVVVP
jgi:hypothetical protein